MRRRYMMSEEDLALLLDSMKPVPLIMLQCGDPPHPQERANAAWKVLGEKMRFDHMTVKPVPEMDNRYFTAEALP